MRHLFFLILLISITQGLIAQNRDSSDTVTPAAPSATQIDSAVLQVISDSIQALRNDVSNYARKARQPATDCKECKECIGKTLNLMDWVLVFLPVLTFVLFYFIIGFGKGFNLAEAFSESDRSKTVKQNPEYNVANLTALANVPNLSDILPPTIEVSDTTQPISFRPSTSRYIAFITSVLTLIIALCMSCFFIYHYIRTGCAPELNALSIVLIALGIGVAPYAFNKISGAISSSKSE